MASREHEFAKEFLPPSDTMILDFGRKHTDQSYFENTIRFLENLAPLRRLKNLGNSWDEFSRRLRMYARVVDHEYPLERPFKLLERDWGEGSVEDLYSEHEVSFALELLVAHQLVYKIVPRLKNENIFQDIIFKVEKKLSPWARDLINLQDIPEPKRKYLGAKKENYTTFEVLVASAKSFDAAQEFTQEEFEFVWKVLFHKLGQVPDSVDDKNIRWSVVMLARLPVWQYEFYVKYFGLPRENDIKKLLFYINALYKYAGRKLGELDSDEHEKTKTWLMEFVNLFSTPEKGYGWFGHFMQQHQKSDPVYGKYYYLRSLRQYANKTQDPWYVMVSEIFTNQVSQKDPNMMTLSQDLAALLPSEPTKSENPWQNLENHRHRLQENSQTENYFTIIFAPESRVFFANTEQVMVSVGLVKPGLYLHVTLMEIFFPGDLESDENDLNHRSFMYVVNFENNPDIILRFIDPENVTEEMKSHLLVFTEAVLKKIKVDPEKTVETNINQQQTYLDPNNVPAQKPKGKQFTPRGEHKRQRPVREKNLVAIAQELVEEIRLQPNQKRLIWHEEDLSQIAADWGYNSAQIDFFLRKMIMFNYGGTSKKPLTYIESEGKPVTEIKAGKFRILARLEGNSLQVFDIVPRRELDDY